MDESSNSTTSTLWIEKHLRRYLAGVEFWAPDFGETSNVLGDRTLLHDALDQLTADQRVEMARADERAKSLYFQHREAFDPYLDIRMLYDMVVLIASERDAPTP